MAKKPSSPSETAPPRWYRGKDVPMRLIRRFARDVAEKFHPEKIILFGSYAYGTPHDDSDVDVLVIMPARNQIDQAVRIDRMIDAPFPLDLIVRTPKNMKWRLAEGDSFLCETCRRGRSFMKRMTREWVRKAEADYQLAKKLAERSEPFYDQRSFLCRQAAEKYLKALLEELDLTVPRTHLLHDLLGLLLPIIPRYDPCNGG